MKVHTLIGSKERFLEMFQGVNKLSLNLNEEYISERKNELPVGTPVRVSDGSGVNSNKVGMVVSPNEIKTNGRGVPINVDGAYKPVDWGRESAVQLDDGNLITMFNNRLHQINGLSEDYDTVSNSAGLLENEFKKLITDNLDIQDRDTRVVGNDTFVELICSDGSGAKIIFNFKLSSNNTELDNVISVDSGILDSFRYIKEGQQPINIEAESLQEFNQQHASEIIDVVSEYAGIESDEMATDSVYEDAVKLIDKVPYKKGTEQIQTSQAYGDEKPTNPDVRVDSPQLDKFVKEDDEDGNPFDYNPEMPPDPDGDDSTITGIDPYDVQDDNTEYETNPEKAQLITQAYDNLINAGNVSPTFDEITREANMMKIEADRAKGIEPKPVEKTRGIPRGAEQFWEGDIADIKVSDVVKQSYHTLLSDEKKKQFIFQAQEIIDNDLGSLKSTIPRDVYIKSVKKEALVLFMDSRPEMNEENEKSDYPDQMGKKFKPKNQMPKKKKRPQSVVKLKEDDESEIPNDIEQLASDKEDAGDMIAGGLADEKSPQDYCPVQLAKGLQVEMEHTNNPLIAVEIVMDHLEEDPQYYGDDNEDPDQIAQQQASGDAGNEDSEVTDELLGYKPHNVSDYTDEEFDYAAQERDYNDKEDMRQNPEDHQDELELPAGFNDHDLLDYEHHANVRDWKNVRTQTEDGILVTQMDGDVEKDNYLFKFADYMEDTLPPDEKAYRDGIAGDIIGEDDGMEEYTGDIGDRYEDANNNQFTVRNKVKGGVTLQGQGGEKEIGTSDLQFMKKLGEDKVVEKEIITEEQISMARQVLKNRGFADGMTKKEAVQLLIKHNIK